MRLVSTFILILTIFGCNREAEVPKYIRIESVEFEETGPNSNGGANIPDAWIYLNDQEAGVFELPCEVAVLNSSPVDIKVRAGIKLNGISNTREAYTFYNTWEGGDIELYEDSVITLTPTVTYNSVVQDPWNEDFEDGVLTIDTVSSSDVGMDRIQTTSSYPDFTNNYVAFSELTADKPGLKLMTKEGYVLPKTGEKIFLELDYKVDQEFAISIIYDLIDSPPNEVLLLTLRPIINADGSAAWNKIYLELTDVIFEFSSSPDYSFAITALHDGSSESAEMYFDNLKLVHG